MQRLIAVALAVASVATVLLAARIRHPDARYYAEQLAAFIAIGSLLFAAPYPFNIAVPVTAFLIATPLLWRRRERHMLEWKRDGNQRS